MVFTGDGLTVASYGEDRTIRMWDVTGGSSKRVSKLDLRMPNYSLWDIATDGTNFALGVPDEEVKVWELSTGRLVQTLRGHSLGSGMSDFRLSADGRTYFGIHGSGRNLKVTDLKTKRYDSDCSPGVGITAIVSRSEILATATIKRQVEVRQVSTGKILAKLPGHPAEVCSLAISADRTTVASGCVNGAVWLWDIGRQKVRHMVGGHQGRVNDVAISADGVSLASAGADGLVIVWDTSSGQERGRLTGRHVGSIESIAFSPDGQLVATGGEDHTVRLWDLSARLD